MSTPTGPSKSSVQKAGSRIRKFTSELFEGPPTEETAKRYIESIAILEEYRSSFAPGTASINMSMRSFVKTCGLEARVTQRLKRMTTIIDKISVRERGLDLSRMRDIGGCRVVLASDDPSDLYRLARHAQHQCRSDVQTVIDYIKTPRQSGYRAIHLIVVRKGRPIEVQLRTARMHQWAETMEAFSDVFGENFKQDGETVVHKFMKAIQEFDSMIEQDMVISEAHVRKANALRDQVIQALKEATDGQD